MGGTPCCHVLANGGQGGSGRGGGGGGRVAILFDSELQAQVEPQPTVLVSLAGGPGSGQPSQDLFLSGAPGTLYISDETFFSTTNRLAGVVHLTSTDPEVTIPHGWTLHESDLHFLPGTKLLVDGSLTLENSSRLRLYGAPTDDVSEVGGTLDINGDFTLAAESWFFPYSDPTNGGSVRVRADNVFMDADGGVNAFGLGYTTMRGPGGATSQGGGGYGGAGGATGGGVAYGDPKLPLAPGSGGGGENGRYYGPGGGLVWIEAPAGVIRVNGTINASGVQAETHRQGGGSGGGVYLLCRTFEGSGSVLADGALGGNSGRGGAGGGRIAVVYDTEVQGSVSPKPTVTFSAKNGLASLRSDYGALGTLYFPDGAFIDLTNTLSGI